MYITMKYLLTAALVVLVSELAKRNPLLGGLIASLPLTSYLAFIWIYYETGNSERIASLSQSIFWLVLPSLVLFIALTWLLRHDYGFILALTLATFATFSAYGLMILLLHYFGISF